MNVEQITIKAISSVAELIDFKDAISKTNDGGSGNLCYRGQPREFKTLVPSFQRQFPSPLHGAAVLIENRLTSAFREHYAALKDRSGDMPSPEQIGEGYDLRCLSVMQHYEIPTRLLDWTGDFWTAIYFACASEVGSNAELWLYDRNLFRKQREVDGRLTSLVSSSATPPKEPSLLNHKEEATIYELDPQITPRMRQQYGHHTFSNDAFADHAPLIEQLIQKIDPERRDAQGLTRVILDSRVKSNALQFLAQEKNITASTIFPDVVGLGRFLRWQFDSLRTIYL